MRCRGAGRRASARHQLGHHRGQPAAPHRLHDPVDLRIVDRNRSGAHLPDLRRSGRRPSRRLDDIRAVGVDRRGSTSFNLVVPALDADRRGTPLLIRLSRAWRCWRACPTSPSTSRDERPPSRSPACRRSSSAPPRELRGVLAEPAEASARSRSRPSSTIRRTAPTLWSSAAPPGSRSKAPSRAWSSPIDRRRLTRTRSVLPTQPGTLPTCRFLVGETAS